MWKNRSGQKAAVFCVVLGTATASHAADDLEPAAYRHEHVAGVWQQDGFLNGPAKAAIIGTIFAMTVDAQGNMYVCTAGRIRIVTLDGRVWNLAGTGVQGYKDGPAESAMFNPGGRGYVYQSIAVDSRGSVFFADGNNDAVRRIFRKDDGGFWVETYIGRGHVELMPGETATRKTIKMTAPLALTVDSADNLWTQDARCVYKVAPSGLAMCYAAETSAAGNAPERVGSAIAMKADELGNVYSLTRAQNDAVYRISSEGVIVRIAGMLEADEIALIDAGESLPVDGPALESTFFETTALAVAPDGSAVYVGNGDENRIRRVNDGHTKTLFLEPAMGWRTSPTSRREGWFLGGPVHADANGVLYLFGNNPPRFLALRRLVPVP